MWAATISSTSRHRLGDQSIAATFCRYQLILPNTKLYLLMAIFIFLIHLQFCLSPPLSTLSLSSFLITLQFQFICWQSTRINTNYTGNATQLPTFSARSYSTFRSNFIMDN